MSDILKTVNEFLAQRHIAIAGVSRKSAGSAANSIYNKLKQANYVVYAINPKAETIEGDPCYSNLKAIEGPVDGVVIVTKPEQAESIVRECLELGIRRVWMHKSFGQGSVSDAAVQLCEENNMAVIPGGCPMMFCEPVDLGHKCIRWFLKLSGGLPK
jgi:predicted CoA-binding protein